MSMNKTIKHVLILNIEIIQISMRLVLKILLLVHCIAVIGINYIKRRKTNILYDNLFKKKGSPDNILTAALFISIIYFCGFIATKLSTYKL